MPAIIIVHVATLDALIRLSDELVMRDDFLNPRGLKFELTVAA